MTSEHMCGTISGPGATQIAPALIRTCIGGPDMQHSTCSVATCERRAVYVTLALCRNHYQDHRRMAMAVDVCSVPGCQRDVGGPMSLCPMHYSRLRVSGEVGGPGPKINVGARRNVTTAGYVRLNRPDHPLAMANGWVFEHRVIAWEAWGPFDPSMHVHHVNGVRHDNRLENLELLTPEDHKREHRTLDRDAMARMYEAGATTTQVAQAIGTHAGNVSRALRSDGVTMRTSSETKLANDPAAHQVHAAAVGARSAGEIASRLGVSVPTIRRLMRQHGIPAFPAGRPVAS